MFLLWACLGLLSLPFMRFIYKVVMLDIEGKDIPFIPKEITVQTIIFAILAIFLAILAGPTMLLMTFVFSIGCFFIFMKHVKEGKNSNWLVSIKNLLDTKII